MSAKYSVGRNVKRHVMPAICAAIMVMQMGAAGLGASAAGIDLEELFKDALNNDSGYEIVTETPTYSNQPSQVILSEGRSEHKIHATDAQKRGEQINIDSVDMTGVEDWVNGTSWWVGRDSVKYAVGMGYVKGVGGSLAGDRNVTNAEFSAVLLRMCVDSDEIARLGEEYRIANYTGEESIGDWDTEHWYVKQGFQAAANKYGLGVQGGRDDVCTRSIMAKMLVDAMESRGESTELTSDNQKAARKVVKDPKAIESCGSSVEKDIYRTIWYGIITGDEHGRFNPTEGMTRAAMCEVLYRLDNPLTNGTGPRDSVIASSGVRNVKVEDDKVEQGVTYFTQKYYSPEGKYLFKYTYTVAAEPVRVIDVKEWLWQSNLGNNELVEGKSFKYAKRLVNTEPIVIDNRTPDVLHRAPMEGDTCINRDGEAFVLRIDPITGVLGAGQDCAPWVGFPIETGKGYIDFQHKQYIADENLHAFGDMYGYLFGHDLFFKQVGVPGRKNEWATSNQIMLLCEQTMGRGWCQQKALELYGLYGYTPEDWELEWIKTLPEKPIPYDEALKHGSEFDADFYAIPAVLGLDAGYRMGHLGLWTVYVDDGMFGTGKLVIGNAVYQDMDPGTERTTPW